jgi:hypothetical protein
MIGSVPVPLRDHHKEVTPGIAANEPVAAFDYNGNGWINFADVVWLFNHL